MIVISDMFPINKLPKKQGVFYLVILAGALPIIIYPLDILESGSFDTLILMESFHRPERNLNPSQAEEDIVSKQQNSPLQQTLLPEASLTNALEVNDCLLYTSPSPRD